MTCTRREGANLSAHDYQIPVPKKKKRPGLDLAAHHLFSFLFSSLLSFLFCLRQQSEFNELQQQQQRLFSFPLVDVDGLMVLPYFIKAKLNCSTRHTSYVLLLLLLLLRWDFELLTIISLCLSVTVGEWRADDERSERITFLVPGRTSE